MDDEQLTRPRRNEATAATRSAAIAALAWAGTALPVQTLLGCRVAPVVRLDVEAHQTRVAHGYGPQLDRDVLTVWEWPEAVRHAPPPALRLVGVLFHAGRSWRPACAAAASWRDFGPTAVLAHASVPVDEIGRLEFGFHGIGLVAVSESASSVGRTRRARSPDAGAAARGGPVAGGAVVPGRLGPRAVSADADPMTE